MLQWDRTVLDRDFYSLKASLNDVRMQALYTGKRLTAKFEGNVLIISDEKGILNQVRIPRLYQVEYDSTFGEDLIVFSKYGTSEHNVRIHGGQITLRSWLGFERYIHVNCAGYVREGRYPDD
jgi:hypothetical protein